jgi:hypothetical protein
MDHSLLGWVVTACAQDARIMRRMHAGGKRLWPIGNDRGFSRRCDPIRSLKSLHRDSGLVRIIAGHVDRAPIGHATCWGQVTRREALLVTR